MNKFNLTVAGSKSGKCLHQKCTYPVLHWH